MNLADAQSRRTDYKIGYERPTARPLGTSATPTVEQYEDLVKEINTALAIDGLAVEVKHRIFGTQIVYIHDLQRIDDSVEEPRNEWKVTTTVLTYQERIYVPKDDLHPDKVMSLLHHNPESGHFGSLKTADLLSTDFHWPAMDATVQKYIA